MKLVESILKQQFIGLKEEIYKKLEAIREQKLVQLKRRLGAILSEAIRRTINEADVVRQGRIKLIRRRIRKGKLQRNIRKSAVKGFTLQRGKLKRIPAARRIHMRIVQRRAERKRKQHLQSSLRKRKISLRKRKAMGIH